MAPLVLLFIDNQLKGVKWRVNGREIILPTGDLRLSKFVIDIFLISENIELVDLRLSPKVIMLVTDNFRLSLCDLSGRETFIWFPDELFKAWLFGLKDDGGSIVIGEFSTVNDDEDLFITRPSSCSTSSSAIVAGWLWFETGTTSFSSFPVDCGDVGGDPGWIAIGGGDGVAELIDRWFANTGSVELIGDSEGSEIQIDACWTESLCRSWFDFYWKKWNVISVPFKARQHVI